MLKSYKELLVWQKSIKFVKEIYRLTNSYPKEELYGITNQTRRAAVSMPTNIAEGYARKHRKEYVQFARIAFASRAELETLLVIAKELKLATSEEFKESEELLEETMKMLNGFIGSLTNR